MIQLDAYFVTCVAVHNGKTQKATSFPVFQSLEVWISSGVYERDVHKETMHNMSLQTKFHAGKPCACQFLHFEHILIVTSETALSFWLKWNFRHLSVFSFVKLWRELRTRRTFDRCEAWRALKGEGKGGI